MQFKSFKLHVRGCISHRF